MTSGGIDRSGCGEEVPKGRVSRFKGEGSTFCTGVGKGLKTRIGGHVVGGDTSGVVLKQLEWSLDKGGGYGRGRGIRFGVNGLREVSEKYFGSAVDGVLDSGGMGRRRSVRVGGALCMDWLMFAIMSCSIRTVSPGPLLGLAVLEVLCGGE